MRRPWSRSGPVPVTATPTRFEGVTRAEVLSRGTGLYEVVTTGGVPVRLHDMSFMSMTFEPASPPSLVLRFGDDEPTPTGVTADTPVAVFTFGSAVVLLHEDERVEPDTPAAALRQVAGFDYDEATATFALSTYTMHLVFTAATMALTLERGQR